MLALENKIPPPLICLFSALLMWWLSSFSTPFEFNHVIRKTLAISLLICGALIGLAGIIEFKRVKTTVNPMKPEAVSSLVSSGIYQFSRNPMYLGMVLVLLAFTVYLSSLVSVVGIVFFILYMNQLQIKPEEKAIEGIFGDEYVLYKNKVRRWI